MNQALAMNIKKNERVAFRVNGRLKADVVKIRQKKYELGVPVETSESEFARRAFEEKVQREKLALGL